MRFVLVSVLFLACTWALPSGAESGIFYLSFSGERNDDDYPCEVDFFFFNGFQETVDAITIAVTLHDFKGHKIATTDEKFTESIKKAKILKKRSLRH